MGPSPAPGHDPQHICRHQSRDDVCSCRLPHADASSRRLSACYLACYVLGNLLDNFDSMSLCRACLNLHLLECFAEHCNFDLFLVFNRHSNGHLNTDFLQHLDWHLRSVMAAGDGRKWEEDLSVSVTGTLEMKAPHKK